MKKLMIAAVAVCAAAMTQAAQVSWSSGTQFMDANGVPTYTLPKGVELVLVNLGNTINFDSVTAKQIIPTTGDDKTTISLSTATSASRTGKVTGTLTFAYVDGVNDLVVNGNYLALMYQDAVGIHQLVYGNGTEVGADATFQVKGIVNNGSSQKVSDATMGFTGNFTTSVPEPTSAMLLLLGVGAMALRRRRA